MASAYNASHGNNAKRGTSTSSCKACQRPSGMPQKPSTSPLTTTTTVLDSALATASCSAQQLQPPSRKGRGSSRKEQGSMELAPTHYIVLPTALPRDLHATPTTSSTTDCHYFFLNLAIPREASKRALQNTPCGVFCRPRKLGTRTWRQELQRKHASTQEPPRNLN